MRVTKENIFKKAIQGNLSVLESPLVNTFKEAGKPEDRTPLHALCAKMGYYSEPFIPRLSSGEIIKYVYPKKWKNRNRELKKWLSKKYPWFNFKDKKVDASLVNEILNTPNALKFILEEKK